MSRDQDADGHRNRTPEHATGISSGPDRASPPPTLNEERKRANARGVNFKVDPNTRTTSFVSW